MAVRTLDPQEKAQLLQRINSGLDARGIDLGKPRLVAEVDRAAIDVDGRRFTYSFSSETPVERWWGIEILSHDPKDVDLSRFAAKAMAPLLVDHDWRIERQVGVIEEATIDGQRKKGYATARMSKKAFAEEQWLELQDGQIGNISVSYDILDIVLVEEKKGAPPVYRCKWRPYENSLVPVAADIKVGAGRGLQSPTAPVTPTEEVRMDPENPTQMGAAVGTATTPAPPPAATPAPDIRGAHPGADPLQGERQRVAEIMAVALHINQPGVMEIARSFVTNGGTPDEFRVAAFRKVHGESSIVPVTDGPNLGLNGRELKRFNLMRLVRHMCNQASPTLRAEAAYEIETCAEYRKKTRGEQSRDLELSYHIPGEVLDYIGRQYQARQFARMGHLRALQSLMEGRDFRASDMAVGTPGLGGYTVETSVLGDQFIELYKAQAVTMGLGRVVGGAIGNVQIPSQTGGSTGYWVAEGVDVTDSALAMGQLLMTPKTAGGYIDATRLLLMQSSIDFENLMVEDLTGVVANTIDIAGIKGGGAGQISGILTLPSGIGNVNMGDNAGAMTWPKIVEFETTAAVANAPTRRPGWLTNPKVRGAAKTTLRTVTYGEKPLWDDQQPNTPLNNYPVWVTNNVPSNYTKGSHGTADLSALIFSTNWDDLVYVLWGGLEIGVSSEALFLSGGKRIRVLQTVDGGLRHPAAFVISDEITTS
jgi:HK97 family phage major capsid protein